MTRTLGFTGAVPGTYGWFAYYDGELIGSDYDCEAAADYAVDEEEQRRAAPETDEED
jgi:hypothetical protein